MMRKILYLPTLLTLLSATVLLAQVRPSRDSVRKSIIPTDSLSHVSTPAPIVNPPHPSGFGGGNSFRPDSSRQTDSVHTVPPHSIPQHDDSLNLSSAGESGNDSSLYVQPTGAEKSLPANLPPGALDTTTISFKNADIRDVFRGLAYQHGLNIFVQNSIDKHVTISLNEVPVYYAIQFLCKQNDLDLTLKGGIFEITVPPPPEIVPPPKPKPYVAYDDGDLWIAADNVSLRSVVQAIRDKSHKNILITEGTSGPVTGQLNIE